MGESTANRPAPSAAGTLAKTPFVNLLVYALERRLSGTLELAAPPPATLTAVILFVGGHPAKVRTSEPVHYLGRVLLELGHLSEEELTRSLADLAQAKAAGPSLHGQLLVRSGKIDANELEAGLREQIARKLRQVVGMPTDTAYSYLDRFDGLRGWGVDPAQGFDPLPMIWGVLRDNPPWEHVRAALGRLGGTPLRLTRTPELYRLALGKQERSAADLLAVRALSPGDFALAANLAEREAEVLLYLLLVTKHVEVVRVSRKPPPPDLPHDVRVPSRPPASVTASPIPPYPSIPSPLPKALLSPPSRPPQAAPPSPVPRSSPFPPSLRPPAYPAPPHLPSTNSASPLPPSGSPPPPAVGTSGPTRASSQKVRPPAPPGLSPELGERWDEILDRAATIDRADYFMMLDLARDASREEVESAFFALAKKWHPDRLPPELAGVRDACSRVFSRMSEAHSTLVDPEKRTRYMRLLADGSGSPEMQETVAKVVEAAQTFQKAEVCFKRSDLAQAEEFCRKAVEADPTQPDYLAMLAWLIALKAEYQSPEKTKECISMLERAISMNDKCERAFFWRGMLYKRLGKGGNAVRDFRRAADLNPRNIDAAREVRLFQMRGGRTSSKPPQPMSSTRPSPLPPRPEEPAKPSGLFGRLFKKP